MGFVTAREEDVAIVKTQDEEGLNKTFSCGDEEERSDVRDAII